MTANINGASVKLERLIIKVGSTVHFAQDAENVYRLVTGISILTPVPACGGEYMDCIVSCDEFSDVWYHITRVFNPIPHE